VVIPTSIMGGLDGPLETPALGGAAGEAVTPPSGLDTLVGYSNRTVSREFPVGSMAPCR
jgi:hypothetical protein